LEPAGQLSLHMDKWTSPIPQRSDWRNWLYVVIFRSDTPAGKAFDVALLWSIFLSVFAVMLESIADVRLTYGGVLRQAEWFFTVLFSLEYILRLISAPSARRYALSFFGIVDLLSILPTFISLAFEGTQVLLVIRAIRLLRFFRIFKLAQYVGEARALQRALRASSPKITVFLGSVLAAVTVAGTVMYMIEGEAHGFTSIPRGIYWAVVTMTTVGYGDIAPRTVLGQLVAMVLMIVGYGIIAVPTGIVSAEMVQAGREASSARICSECAAHLHDADAAFCKHCGSRLRENGKSGGPNP